MAGPHPCDSCGTMLEIGPGSGAYATLTCPRCLAEFDNPYRDARVPPPLPSFDWQVRRETTGTGAGLGFLAVLGVIGAALVTQDLWLLVLGLALLLTGFALSGRPGDRTAQGFGRVIIGALAVLGMFAFVGLAGLIFLFVTCAKMLEP